MRRPAGAPDRERALRLRTRATFQRSPIPQAGLFELANTGTLFLHEIGELEPRMQVKLLRVLEAMPYYRLGGTKKITVDVRVLTATNVDLEVAVLRQARFRRDLYHRLSQMTLRVPPLRERPEDAQALALRTQHPMMLRCAWRRGSSGGARP
ncbi:MAG: sigma 54-interacting transcriptional regulator [Paludibaculum sp.]